MEKEKSWGRNPLE